MRNLDRVTQSHEPMGRRACIRGMRVTVGMVVGQIAAGCSIDEVLAEYSCLERDDVRQALRYATWRGVACRGKETPAGCSVKLLIDMNGMYR